MCGALGGRIDHEIVNLRLVYKSPGRISIMDDQNRITAYGVGRHVIKAEGYSYISFFTESEAIISLENMKYPLRDRRITYRDLYTVSNEILSEEGILEVSSGSVLVIQSKDQ
jgi:thiamine pyrophosphokinase